MLTCTFGAFVAGNDTRTSLRVGMGLAQIGEFSFIIASLGLSLGVTSAFLYPIAVTVSALTTLTTPYLLRHSDALVNWFSRSAPTRWVDYLAPQLYWPIEPSKHSFRTLLDWWDAQDPKKRHIWPGLDVTKTYEFKVRAAQEVAASDGAVLELITFDRGKDAALDERPAIKATLPSGASQPRCE